MKKIISILCVLGRVLFETVGQNISSGARAGLNLANMTGDIEDIAMKTSFHLGGYVNIGFSEALSLQPVTPQYSWGQRRWR